MRVKIEKGKASGKILAPPSKSMAHRLLIGASFADGVSTVRGISFCEDVLATLDCLNSLGIKTEIDGTDVRVFGRDYSTLTEESTLFCRESGSTLRFMIPPALLSGKKTVFSGAPSLMKRPMSVYKKLSSEHGFEYREENNEIHVRGPLKSGEYRLPGDVSSQFISGLLFALPTLRGESTVKLTSSVESRSYINMTLKAIEEFGIKCRWLDDYTIFIPGGQKYLPKDVTVEGDYSGASFPLSLNCFGSSVEIGGLREDSIQGDKVFEKHFASLSRGIPAIHIGDCPDLGPILFAVAAAKCGGVFDGTKRLRIKESDRCAAMAMELMKFGTSVSIYDNTVVIYPRDFHRPTEVLHGHNDHRIVMALSVLLTLVGGEIDGAEAVSKSYPGFFDDLRSLGIEVTEYEA